MNFARNMLFAVVGLGLVAWTASNALAQTAPGGAQRDCQTIRTCNFSRGGSYRGCLSSYSCRICRTIRTSCTIDGTRRICQEMKCAWG